MRILLRGFTQTPVMGLLPYGPRLTVLIACLQPLTLAQKVDLLYTVNCRSK